MTRDNIASINLQNIILSGPYDDIIVDHNHMRT